MNHKLKVIISWMLTLALMFLIFHFSAQPALESGDLSEGITMRLLKGIYGFLSLLGVDTARLPNVDTMDAITRKVAHFVLYLLLGISFLISYRTTFPRCARNHWWAFGSAALYAVMDEVHQIFVPGRAGMWQDVLLDSSGAAFGIFLCLWLAHASAKRKRET